MLRLAITWGSAMAGPDIDGADFLIDIGAEPDRQAELHDISATDAPRASTLGACRASQTFPRLVRPISPTAHPKANSMVKLADGIDRVAFPVSGSDHEQPEDTLRIIAWRPQVAPIGGSTCKDISVDVAWLNDTLAKSDLPTIVVTPPVPVKLDNGDRAGGRDGLAKARPAAIDLAMSFAEHGHVVAWVSSHAGPMICSLRAGIAVIVFDASDKASRARGLLGMLEVGNRLAVDLKGLADSHIDLPLRPPTDRWHAAL